MDKLKAFMKKYNLSINDIHVLFLITAGECKRCFYFNLLPVLDKYGIKYKIDEDNISFELLEEEEWNKLMCLEMK